MANRALSIALAGMIVLTSVLSSSAHGGDQQPPPAPYSLPWQLRPALAVTALRSDTAIDLFNGGHFVASMLLGSYAISNRLAVFVRLAVAGGELPNGTSGAIFGNPMFGGQYILPLPASFRLAFTLALSFPGMPPSAERVVLGRAAQTARSQLDNAMFAMNDDVILIGVDAAWVRYGLTIQVEGTVLQLLRQQGGADVAKTNFTCGLHVGYFPIKYLSIGAELRYQRWLTTPSFVEIDPSGTVRDTFSIAAGVRGHIPLGKHWLRPGVAYARGLDDPMATANHDILLVDIPFIF